MQLADARVSERPLFSERDQLSSAPLYAMVGVISHRPVRYLSHITVISGAQNRQALGPKTLLFS